MKIVVTDEVGQKFFPLEFDDETDLAAVKSICDAQFGGPPGGRLFHISRELTSGSNTLTQLGVANDDMLVFKPAARPQPKQTSTQPPQQFVGGIDFSSIQIPGSSQRPPQSPAGSIGNPTDLTATLTLAAANAQLQQLKTAFQQHPGQLAELKDHNPELYDAVKKGDDAKTIEILQRPMLAKLKQMEMHRRAMADPFDVEAQLFVENEIKQQNIDATFDTAIEHIPESFSSVYMLYIKCRVNGHEVKAFVDSGAQSTIISIQCATRCNIRRLVDERFAGMAKGVGGEQKIVGKIHMAQLQVENDFFPVSFIVLEQEMDLLFGLDMLKRHHCVIDLKNGVLHMGSSNTSTPFLAENEIPKFDRLSHTPSSARSSIASPVVPSILTAEHEGKIDQMVAMGFTRDDSIKELNNSEWNVPIAIAKMFEKQTK